jgi:hypothetical protein
MESLERFHQYQRIIDDFTSNTLAAIPGDFGRLIHIATLRDLISGQYKHEGLEALYSAPAVHEALLFCHEQIFQRILETPLERQERLFRDWLSGLQGDSSEIAARWKELEVYRMLIPLGIPEYLRDLFCSDFRMLLELVCSEPTAVPAAA